MATQTPTTTPATTPAHQTQAAALKTDTAKPKGPVQVLAKRIEDHQASFAQVATRYMTPERLVKLAQVVISKKPELAECSTISVLECLMTCSRLGLEPNEPGGVWLVPFKGVCTSIIDYRGLIDVCRRSKQIAVVHAGVRCEKDSWVFSVDTEAATLVKLKHTAADGDRGAVLGFYFVAKLDSGECQATYLSKGQVDQFRARSKADQKGFSPWQSDYEAMAIKTVCRRGVNLLPRTPDTQALREELHREDTNDSPMIGELSEDSQEAIDRMLQAIHDENPQAAIRATEAFKSWKASPAKQLQILTRFSGQPTAKLMEFLEEQDSKQRPAETQPATTEAPAQTTQPAAQAAPAATTQAQAKPKAQGKKKKGQKGKGGTKPAPRETDAAPTATNQPAAATEAPKPETVPQPAQPAAPAKPPVDPTKFEGSF
jgi:recombination protein RecT